MHNRYITSTTNAQNAGNQRTNTPSADERNKYLLRAITFYLHQQVKLDLRDANVELTNLVDLNNGRATLTSTLKTIGSVLQTYHLIKKPLVDEWHNLGKYGEPAATVRLRIEYFSEKQKDQNQNQTNGGDNGNMNINQFGNGDGENGQQVTKRYHFESTSGQAIDAFLDTAYRWYIKTLRKSEDSSRHLYELKSTGYQRYAPSGQEAPLQCRYTRYKLSDEKTFDSLFFRAKADLLRLLQQFRTRTGKYAIKGYPHKLGLLLHGPPGTGSKLDGFG